MKLVEVVVKPDKETGDPVLVFQFDEESSLTFDCPIGQPAEVALELFHRFILMAKGFTQSDSTQH